MTTDPAVLAAIRSALETDPRSVPLRVHLAQLLLEGSDTEGALTEARTVLAEIPDHVEALRTAADAAESLGFTARVESYRRLLAGLESVAQSPDGDHETAPDSARTPLGFSGAAVPETAADLLAGWSDSAPLVEVETGTLTAPGVRLADVGGMSDVKKRLELSFLRPLRNPAVSAQFGKSMRGGLLLWGPPGCGKTFIARATAGEIGAQFYEIALSDVLDMWIGSSERNLHQIFEVARSNRPCVLFFDEMDALGQKRTSVGTGGSAMRGVVNQLLAEMDGASSDNDGVFVLAATNHPWDVDTALLRPGRFDRMLLVLPPDLDARAAILDLHLRGKPIQSLDTRKIAKQTEGFTGADLALLIEHATETAMDESLESGELRPIVQRDLMDAAKELQPSGGPWFETAKNYATYGTDGTYGQLLEYIRRRRR